MLVKPRASLFPLCCCLGPRPQHYFILRLQLLAQVSTLEAARGAAAAGLVLLLFSLHTLILHATPRTTTILQMLLTAAEFGGALPSGLLPPSPLVVSKVGKRNYNF